MVPSKTPTGPRPGTPLPTILIGIRVSAEQREQLIDYARQRGLSMTHAARELLAAGMPTATKPRSRGARP